MALFKILLIILFPCILTIIIILKMGAHFKNLYTEKEKQTRREKTNKNQRNKLIRYQ